MFFKRSAKFLMVLVHNKRGLLGIGILIFFTVLAVAAPLLTPYDPVHSDVVFAADLTYPTWLKYLPGYEKTSENLNPIEDSGFMNEKSLQQWVFTVSPSNPNLTTKYVSDVGSPISPAGCVALTLQRDQAEPAQEAKAVLTKEFYYPYSGPPKRFMGQIFILAEGIKDVPQWGVEIKVFIQRAGEAENYLWSAKQGGKFESETWITPSVVPRAIGSKTYPPLIDSYILDPRGLIFSKQTNYKYGVEVLFSKDVQKASVYIDNLNLKLYGTAYGLFGTDNAGLDIYTQLIYGTRISLIVGLIATLISVVLGLTIGLVSAYLGRAVDEILMRLTDMFLVIPELPLLLVIIAVLGRSIWNIILIIGFLGWMGFARTVRSQALSLKERPYVEAARAVGASNLHIIVRHILPNVMNLVYVTLAMSVPGAIMSEAYLSFLGLYDPYIMTWGRMFHEALALPGGVQRWWWIIPPGLCIAAISISFILIGYALDEILNPRVRERR